MRIDLKQFRVADALTIKSEANRDFLMAKVREFLEEQDADQVEIDFTQGADGFTAWVIALERRPAYSFGAIGRAVIDSVEQLDECLANTPKCARCQYPQNPRYTRDSCWYCGEKLEER